MDNKVKKLIEYLKTNKDWYIMRANEFPSDTWERGYVAGCKDTLVSVIEKLELIEQ